MISKKLESIFNSAEKHLYGASVYSDGDVHLLELTVGDSGENAIPFEYESEDEANQDLKEWEA
jgi:hypothetical protein